MTLAAENRILVFAPTGRDSAMICEALGAQGMTTESCASVDAACRAIQRQAGALLIAEEAFDSETAKQLVRTLEHQEPWSDLPVVVLAGGSFSDSADRAARVLGPLRNVMVLERPVRVPVLVTAMQVALRARTRQYEMRGYLELRDRHAQERAAMLVSERHARRDAEAANRLKDEFLATVSHELRTPVNVILGWSGILRRDGMSHDQSHHALDVIHRNALAQARVIDELLDISRIVTGKLRLETAPLSLLHLLTDVIESVRPAMDAKGLTVETRLSPRLPPLTADADRLRQIFWNLLMNAVKFTPSGGRITMTAEQQHGDVEIRLLDTGIGIAPDALPFIFERFRQADGTTTRAHGGLGLGLAIVRQLVELHGGTVTASSHGTGTGAQFVIKMPLGPEGERAQAAAPPAGGHDQRVLPRLDAVRVLLVEEETDDREMVATLLRGQGALVECLADNATDEEQRHPFHPNVMIVDTAMRTADGYRLVSDLRAINGNDAVPAIALTAYVRADDRLRAEKAGFNAYIPKPFDELLLLVTIRDLTLDVRHHA